MKIGRRKAVKVRQCLRAAGKRSQSGNCPAFVGDGNNCGKHRRGEARSAVAVGPDTEVDARVVSIVDRHARGRVGVHRYVGERAVCRAVFADDAALIRGQRLDGLMPPPLPPWFPLLMPLPQATSLP